jgi:hypothetical protein
VTEMTETATAAHFAIPPAAIRAMLAEGDILPGDVGLMQRARRLAAIEILAEG